MPMPWASILCTGGGDIHTHIQEQDRDLGLSVLMPKHARLAAPLKKETSNAQLPTAKAGR